MLERLRDIATRSKQLCQMRNESLYILDVLLEYCQVLRLCLKTARGLMASSTFDVVMSAKRELSRSGNVSICLGVAKKSAHHPPIVYVLTVILSSFKDQLSCGSWLCVAVVSEEMEEFF